MVRFLKQRRIQPFEYRASDEQRRIIESHRVKRCGVCTLEVPEADVVVEDGVEKCPMCRDLYTAEWLANEQQRVAEVKAESAVRLNLPPQNSYLALNDSRPGVVTAITDFSGNALSQNGLLTFPRVDTNGLAQGQLLMPRGTARGLLLVGRNFTAANVTTYPSGITDSVAPVITPSLITLTIVAALGMTPGSYGFTIADGVTQTGHEYPRLFAVR